MFKKMKSYYISFYATEKKTKINNKGILEIIQIHGSQPDSFE